MSVLLIIFNKNGAVICSDSRENRNVYDYNDTIKVRSNESIIVGQMGIYKYNNVDFKTTITEGLLAGKELKQILSTKYKNTNKTLKELIPEGKMCTVFYAKKNGEIGVYDIKKDTELKNLANIKKGYFRNTGASRKAFDGLVDSYLKFDDNESVSSLLKKGEFLVDNFIRLEENYEKISNTPSIVGGYLQSTYIEFELSKENNRVFGKYQKYVKGDKYIYYNLIKSTEYPFLCEYRDNAVHINVRPNYDVDEINRLLFKQFDHFYQMINDPEFRKFYGKPVVHYLGKAYVPKTKKSNEDRVEIKGDTITVYCKEDTITQHKAIYRRFLKKAVEETIVKIYYEAQRDFPEVNIPNIVVKGLKSKKCLGMNAWDTIYLESDLGRYAEKYIKAVLYHELSHFFVIEHNDDFYRVLDERMENGSKIDKELDKLIYVDQF